MASLFDKGANSSFEVVSYPDVSSNIKFAMYCNQSAENNNNQQKDSQKHELSTFVHIIVLWRTDYSLKHKNYQKINYVKKTNCQHLFIS